MNTGLIKLLQDLTTFKYSRMFSQKLKITIKKYRVGQKNLLDFKFRKNRQGKNLNFNFYFIQRYMNANLCEISFKNNVLKVASALELRYTSVSDS